MQLNSWGMYPIIKNNSFILKSKNKLVEKLDEKKS